MTRNLWIGRPGLMREIPHAAKSWDRSADLNSAEFRSLEGRVTTVAPPRTTRRLKLSWDWMEPADAQHLVRLARRVNGPGLLGEARYAGAGPLAVLDPASFNLLDPLQAAGQTERARENGWDHWFTDAGSLTLSPYQDDVVLGSTDDPATSIGWRHHTWNGWPVMPGMRVSWLVPPDWDPLTCTAQLDWKDADGTYLSTTSAQGPLVTGTAPQNAALVTPVAKPGSTGLVGLAGACLTYGDEPVAYALGDGCPAMAVTACTDAPAARLPYRSISIDLVEVIGAAI